MSIFESFKQSKVAQENEFRFWVVAKPSKHHNANVESVEEILSDILFKASVKDIIEMAKGGLDVDDIVAVYPIEREKRARELAIDLSMQRPGSLNI